MIQMHSRSFLPEMRRFQRKFGYGITKEPISFTPFTLNVDSSAYRIEGRPHFSKRST